MNNKTLYKYLQYLALCDLKTKDYKVILYLLKKLQRKLSIKVNQNELADELGISKSDVSKALFKLEKIELISFEVISERKKTIQLVGYSDEDLGDLITEKIESNNFFDFI